MHSPGAPASPANPDTAALLQQWRQGTTPLGPPEHWPAPLTVLLSLMMNASQAMFLAWGPELRMFYNDVYATILGERHPAAFGAPFRAVWADAWPVVGPFVERVLSGLPSDMEDLAVPLDRGGRREEAYFSFSYTPVLDGPGQVIGLFCACTETTRSVQARRTQAQAEQRHRELLDAMGEGLLVLDRDDRVVRINEAGLRLLGQPREAVLGQLHSTVWPGLDGATLAAAVRPAMSHRVAVELHHHCVSATRDFWLHLRAYPVSDGMACLVRDITDIVAADTALQHSEQRFRAAIEAIGVMWTNSADGRMLGPQPGWERLTGQPQPVYQGIGWAEAVHPDDRVASVTAWQAAVQARGTFAFEHRVRRRDGVWRRFAIRAVPVLDRAGEVREWVGVHIDITEAAQAAEALHEADRRKDEFIATLAHELRNPLAPVRSAAYLLGRDDLDRERQVRCGDIIRRQVDTMAVLLDDLLDISRITTGRLPLRRQYVDVKAAVHSAVEIARPWIDARHHRLHTRIAEGLPQLDADPIRVAQILGNLLNNAAKYTDDGGDIRLNVTWADRQLRFEVSDTGIGIAADMLPRVFEMFRQVPEALDRSAGGLGIGLALTQGLVHLHGGTLHAASAGPGQGATFTVLLPAADLGARTPPHDDAQATEASGDGPARRLVLVVDDNVDAAEALCLLLESEGYRVGMAHTAQEALRLGAQVHPDLALLDIGLPGMSGYELAAAMRRTAWGHALPLAALTGWGQEDDRRVAMAAGFDHHFTKPVNPAALLDWLARQGAAG